MNWKSLDTSASGKFGVYRLKNAMDEIVYVGQSVNVMARVPVHKDKFWCSADWIEVSSSNDLRDLEMMFIAKYKPIYNKEKFYHPTFGNFNVRGVNRTWKTDKELRVEFEEQQTK